MPDFLTLGGGTTGILASLSVILLAGFLVTRLTKLAHLPNVSGFILAGVLIGPQCLGLISQETVEGMAFVSDMALAVIAFGIGRYFRLKALRGAVGQNLLVTLCESLLAGVLVTLTMHYLMGLGWDFSLLLGSVATATTPASTMMTIRQYHARGEFVNTLLQVVAFDDVFCLLIFSVVSGFVSGSAAGVLDASDVLLPLAYNLASLALGFGCGWLLSRLLTPSRSNDNRLILTIAILLGISALCALVNISPLLGCMVFGATYINLTRDKRLYKQLNRFTPPVMSLFFIVSGMKLDLSSLGLIGLVGVVYFLVRIVGKYCGTFLGCALVHKPAAIRKYLGIALIPQASVAIGLAFLGERILPAEIGQQLVTIVLAASVLYELCGPACAKLALFRSGAIGARPEAVGTEPELPESAEEAVEGRETEDDFVGFRSEGDSPAFGSEGEPPASGTEKDPTPSNAAEPTGASEDKASPLSR